MFCVGTEQVPGHEDVPRGTVLHEARQLWGQCHEPRSNTTATASATGRPCHTFCRDL
jgi:hypothetical protein